jgi:hypothetical protein
VSFCDGRGIISEFQSGFRPGHSMITALLKVTVDISVELERKFLTILVLLDFSKAFDTISHDLLGQKFNFLFNFSDFAVRFVQLPRVFHRVLSLAHFYFPYLLMTFFLQYIFHDIIYTQMTYRFIRVVQWLMPNQLLKGSMLKC